MFYVEHPVPKGAGVRVVLYMVLFREGPQILASHTAHTVWDRGIDIAPNPRGVVSGFPNPPPPIHAHTVGHAADKFGTTHLREGSVYGSRSRPDTKSAGRRKGNIFLGIHVYVGRTTVSRQVFNSLQYSLFTSAKEVMFSSTLFCLSAGFR